MKAPIGDKKEVKTDQTSRPQKDFFPQAQKQRTEMVNSLYKEPVYQIVEKIKNGPYFHWPNKMSRYVTRRNQNLYYLYHRDWRHTIEDCQTLRDHLHQLEKAGYLAKFLVWEDSRPQDSEGRNPTRTSTVARGLIGVIHTAGKWVDAMKTPSRVLAISSESDTELEGPVHKKSRWEDESINFTGKDLRDTVQPHEDALVVTL